ncbi:MAG: DNA methylase [Anaerolineaceae bacterium]|nr:DNA methylase [Anaerolineaceae bacterium]
MKSKPRLRLQTTTLWEYPSQHYGAAMQGDRDYRGATPSYIIWNLLQRYTREKDLVVDPMAGSGTTLDVARELGRRALGYDVHPTRKDIFKVDARKLPLEDGKADFVFVDPPYSTHIDYGDDPRCIGKLDSADRAYYEAMEQVVREIHRVLKDRRYMALYVSDSFTKGRPFSAIGFELFAILRKHFKAVDIVAVVRHNAKLKRSNWHKAAVEGNFFLRGFNYLLIMKKEAPAAKRSTAKRGKTKGGTRKVGKTTSPRKTPGRKSAQGSKR